MASSGQSELHTAQLTLRRERIREPCRFSANALQETTKEVVPLTGRRRAHLGVGFEVGLVDGREVSFVGETHTGARLHQQGGHTLVEGAGGQMQCSATALILGVDVRLRLEKQSCNGHLVAVERTQVQRSAVVLITCHHFGAELEQQRHHTLVVVLHSHM
jgi:hypothetical protein